MRNEKKKKDAPSTNQKQMGKEQLKQQRVYYLIEVSGRGNVEVAVDAWGLEVQALREFDLSVFFASMNDWNHGYFDETFTADDD